MLRLINVALVALPIGSSIALAEELKLNAAHALAGMIVRLAS